MEAAKYTQHNCLSYFPKWAIAFLISSLSVQLHISPVCLPAVSLMGIRQSSVTFFLCVFIQIIIWYQSSRTNIYCHCVKNVSNLFTKQKRYFYNCFSFQSLFNLEKRLQLTMCQFLIFPTKCFLLMNRSYKQFWQYHAGAAVLNYFFGHNI